MSKIGVFLLMFTFIGQLTYSQGIEFQHITFDEAIQKAKEENKMIFIDFYTQWCGPCKKLAAGPFREAKVGEFYNAHFINLKLDAEKEGFDVARKYEVSSYPTLMFVDGNGKMIYRSGGIKHATDMVGFAKLGLNALNDKYSFEELQSLFAHKQDDEVFLKRYYEKMMEYGISPAEGIDAWLKVQTEVNESDAEMMQFLLKNTHFLCVGGKAHEILTTNYDHYQTLATDYQKRVLSRMEEGMLQNTMRQAYKARNPELMRLFIEKSKADADKLDKANDLNYYEMEYLLLAGEFDAFQKKAVSYVDSLMSMRSIKEIKKSDADFYNSFAARNEPGKSATIDEMLQTFKEGKTANSQVKMIVETGRKYLQYCDTKEEFKQLNRWIDYCYKLIPEKYSIDNLKANTLYTEGETEKAIALKRLAIDRMPDRKKEKVNVKYELDQMLQGGALMEFAIDGKY